MSDLSTRLQSINDRIAAASVQRSRRAMELVALNLVVVVTAASFLIFGLPAQKTIDLRNQEITWAR